ncbi:MAG: extracellular solute-binding protein [Dehalococcoidia bacterium]|nr:extracellular solute-binding protein [Dehalococcoidia bacterium]
MRSRITLVSLIALATTGLGLLTACGGGDDGALTIYAGRSQTLVHPLLEQFSKDTGIKINVRYGDGTDLALGILEEGQNSPADIYYTQDVGALGALKAANRLQTLPDDILNKVPEGYRSSEGYWVGVSGRARVMVYNTDDLQPADLPTSALDYSKPEWRNRIGVVPRSDGFPEFVTALRLIKGDEFALQWLKDLRSNNPKLFPNNLSALQTVANNEIDVAFLNHYYLYRFLEERGEGFEARNYFFKNGDVGGIFLVSGAAILDTAKNREAAEQFIEYLLTNESQQYFTHNTYEYPLVPGVETNIDLPPIESLKTTGIDLSDLTDLQGSLDLMREAGILP